MFWSDRNVAKVSVFFLHFLGFVQNELKLMFQKKKILKKKIVSKIFWKVCWILLTLDTQCTSIADARYYITPVHGFLPNFLTVSNVVYVLHFVVPNNVVVVPFIRVAILIPSLVFLMRSSMNVRFLIYMLSGI